MAENGMLKVATRSTTRRPLLALEKIELPARQMPVHRTRTMVPQRYSHQKPSMRKSAADPDSEPKFSVRQFTRPTAFIPVLSTKPRYKTMPMEPPNSGPSDREMR
jgi:hypothetical protein